MKTEDKKMKAKNIIFVTISMTGGGTERVIATLANHWSELGNTVHIIMIGGDDVAYELDDRIDLRCISSATGGSLSARLGRITNLRKEFKEDNNAVIIAMGTVASMFSAVSALGLKNTLLLSERNDPNRLNHRPIKRYEKWIRNLLYKTADRIVFQTYMARDCFPNSIKKKGSIIMNPIREDIQDGTVYNKRRNVIMTAGRLTGQKNHKLLIDAFAGICDRYPDYKLEIYGEGEYRDILNEYISEKKLDERISLKGFCDNLSEIMCNTKLYVSSSDWEGISNSLAEAMASGMSVIATDCPMGGSAALIKDSKNGKLVRTADLGDMEKALEELLKNEEAAEDIANNAKKCREDLSVERVAYEWETLMI